MKVTLINPPQNTKYPQPPIGLGLLGAVLEGNGYDVKIIDTNINKYEISIDTKIIGITSMTPNINTTLRMLHELKGKYPNVITMLGGMHATILPDETINSDIDILVKGEGDNAIIEVIRNNMKGVYESLVPVNMDALPYPAFHLMQYESYKPHPPHGRALPFLPILTSRGCPYKCVFCAGSVFGKKYRAQSPIRVVDEIEYYVKKLGVKEIAFYDDVFTLDKKRVHGIADEILRRNLKVIWTCEARVNLVDKELLWHMKRAGCYSVAYGIESGSEEILNILDKDITIKQIEDAIRISREVGLETVGYFMVGMPDETLETIQQTIHFAQRLKLDYAQFSITTPFPGTKLYSMYFNGEKPNYDNFVYASTGNKTAPVFESKLLSRKDIEYWASQAYKEFYIRPSYIWQRLSGIRSIGDIKVLAKGLSMLRGM